MFEDLMNITIETGDAFLDKKLNSHICYKGGGNRTTQSSSVPEWLKPHAEGFLRKASSAHARGDLSNVAGFNADQTAARQAGRTVAGQQDQLAQQAQQRNQELYGRGPTDTSAIRDAFLADARRQGGQAAAGAGAAAAGRGTLGGARASAAQAAGRAQAQEGAALGFAQAQQAADQQDFSNKAGLAGQAGNLQQLASRGAQTLGAVGQQGQAQAQKEADSTFQGLQRYAGLLGGASGLATNKSQSQGGGK